MSENSNVAKPFSMLEYGSYTAGIGLLLSLIVRFFIMPNCPQFTEIANFATPLITPVLSWIVALTVGRFGTTPAILRMRKNIKKSIKELRNKIQENTNLLPEKDLDKLKSRLALHIDAQSLIGISIHNEQDLLNYINSKR
ncbi:hypothetical protein [Avibacterium paragallinarum]|uniref:hypothetical protein n=1 Tax=Avibacterium paragallinarum TaxID=728 RepID=UPI00102945D2|nr:hypothetical protein [Avibacterium paragallinarum]RZN54013.1 hypothetical protein EIG78_12115 [Avibacterium paragallinarum]TID11349.1 hypothetical protein JO83_13105 [Avibacterium paragallinarum]